MQFLQRFSIVLFGGLYWLVSVLIAVVVNARMTGSTLTLGGVLGTATPAALAGSLFGLIAALASYFLQVSGRTFLRVAMGVAVGLIFWSLTNIVYSQVRLHGTLAETLFRVVSNPMMATLLGAIFGLVTTRKIFLLLTLKDQCS